MNELPKGWRRAELGDVAEYLNGAAFKPDDWGDDGMPIIRIQNLTDADKPMNRTTRLVDERLRVQDGDILVSWSATLDAFIWNRGEAWLNQHIFRVLPKNHVIDKHFLFFLLRREIASLIETEHLHGSTMRHINRGPFLSHQVALPPLDEQRRIVAKLDALFGHSKAARAHLAHAPRLAERAKQAVLAAAFSGELTQDWREAHKLPEPERTILGAVASSFAYGSSAKSEESGKIPVLRMGNIQSGLLDWSNLVFTSDSVEIAKYLLKPGDVLFNRTNSPELVGKTALYDDEREAIYAGYLIRVRCKPNLMPKFLAYCLNSPIGRDYCWQVKTDGVSQSNINSKKLAAFSFYMPSLEEQTEIVARIEAAFAQIERLADEVRHARALLDRVEQATLAQAFRGQL